MLGLMLLALASDVEQGTPLPCLPAVSGESKAPSAIADHRALRRAVGEPMPRARTMVMIYGKGGHLVTSEYSIILARSADGAWHGSAAGRSQVWIKGAPYTNLAPAQWVLHRADGHQLDLTIAGRCFPNLRSAGSDSRSFVAERLDIVRPGHATRTFHGMDVAPQIMALLRPPK